MSPVVTFYKQTGNIDPKPKRQHAFMPKLQIGPATLGVITVLVILLMSLLYLIQANSTATKGFEIENEQERIKKLDSQGEKLELEMAKLRSTNQLNQMPEKLNLVPQNRNDDVLVFLKKNSTLAQISPESEGANPKR